MRAIILALVIVWAVSIIAGIILGRSKDQPLPALLLTLFLGPVGLLILFFLPNKIRETEEQEKRLNSLEEQLSSHRDEQAQKLLEEANASRLHKSEPAQVISLRIARNGKDLGEMKLDVVKTMLSDGKLAPEDFYLDTATNEWMPLDCHPAIIR